MTVIDGAQANMGRMASVVAKKLLSGEQVDLINAEKIVISGNKEQMLEKYKKRSLQRYLGNPKIGPKFYRMPTMIVKAAVRGMLPIKTPRGREAMKKFKAYIGVPRQFKESKPRIISEAAKGVSKKLVSVEEISRMLGAKW
ncbi:MAG: 50S ribosomal protein L13 [archaeon]